MMNEWDTLIKVGRRVVVNGESGNIVAIRYKPYRVYVWFDGASWATLVDPQSIKKS
jgi:hypothetical protein